MTLRPVRLREWEAWSPERNGEGWGVFLGEDAETRHLARQLTGSGILSFAGVAPALIVCVTREQHIAEKRCPWRAA